MLHKLSQPLTCDKCSKLAFAAINNRNLCSNCLFAEILSMLDTDDKESIPSIIPLPAGKNESQISDMQSIDN
ncbi:MAG: hypothetical protein JXR91_02285 [Deltaproteobacteria bacterium]|nr:hypothetical protein [Deltaproteobacteria bacterium]